MTRLPSPRPLGRQLRRQNEGVSRVLGPADADPPRRAGLDDAEAARGREILSAALLAEDPVGPLAQMLVDGTAERFVPELLALQLEQDPVHRHKDVLAHTVAVTAKTRPDLRLRLAALFHDIGKPATRSFEAGKVTFYQHEAVGAKITRKRLQALRYPTEVVADVAELVRLSGRFKGFGDGWSDAAVRRYARDAGHLLGRLNELVRCDCTTQNKRRAAWLQRLVDELEERIRRLAAEERRAAERPLLDGHAVMARLGVGEGPEIGAALKFLLELRRRAPDLDVAATEQRLDEWWTARRGAGA